MLNNLSIYSSFNMRIWRPEFIVLSDIQVRRSLNFPHLFVHVSLLGEMGSDAAGFLKVACDERMETNLGGHDPRIRGEEQVRRRTHAREYHRMTADIGSYTCHDEWNGYVVTEFIVSRYGGL